MKWEEALEALNEIIPQDAGYFTLKVEQFWHGDLRTRNKQAGPPTVKVSINTGPNGDWCQLEAGNLEALVAKVRWAYENRPAIVPTAIEAEEAEAAEIVESGEGLATEEVPWPPHTMMTVEQLNADPKDDEPF